MKVSCVSWVIWEKKNLSDPIYNSKKKKTIKYLGINLTKELKDLYTEN